MAFSPQSQSIIDRLLSGEKIQYDALVVGPLDQSGQILLRIFCDSYDEFQKRKGDDRATFLRTRYADAKEAAKTKNESDRHEPLAEPLPEVTPIEKEPEATETCDAASEKGYLLSQVTCTSFRGVAPAGESVDFAFDGKSNLIYGPNGSGKTSLLGAVIWVLTGHPVSDAHESSETAPVHDVSTSDGKGKKIVDWAVVATLPDGKITKDTVQECSAQIELVSSDGNSSLHLRRSIAKGLEVSEDGTNWSLCHDLSPFGIEPLDLQLSLVAPTTFGRFTVENAPNTKSLLALMLGFDDLENLGDLATDLSRNRTTLANKEQAKIKAAWDDLDQRLRELPERLRTSHKAHKLLEKLATTAKVSDDQIEAADKSLSEFIEQANTDLAALIGLDEEESADHADLPDKLTGAVLALEKGMWENFPLLGQLRLDTVFRPSEESSSDELLEQHDQELNEFIRDAITRIGKRSDWWHSETAPGSKATLLLHAAKYYEPATEACPVCELSIKDLPVNAELGRLKDHDPELQEKVNDFFRNLGGELDKIISSRIRDLARQPPRKRILDDWEKITNQTLPTELAPLTTEFRPLIEKIANGIEIDDPAPIDLLPKDAGEGFADGALEFVRAIELARMAFAIFRWSQNKLSTTKAAIDDVVTNPLGNERKSLLGALAVGKEAAAAVSPLKALRKELGLAYKNRKDITNKEAEYALLVELQSPLDTLKLLKKYAESEVQGIFTDIRENTLSNWKTMYPETSSGLTPAGLEVGEGRDKSVTSFLSKGEYAVEAKYFANAGLLRAIALSFYFAILEKHPRGLGFVIMDDPILSLDDGHRESWSRDILMPYMKRSQFIIATHQAHYVANCRSHFNDGEVVELNPRPRESRISRRPGNRLDRAAEELDRAPANAPNEMRKYREDLLYTLDAYSTLPFFDRGNLTNSLKDYGNFTVPHPLASNAQRKIMATLLDACVTTVLDPGSHASTEANVTAEMSKTCLNMLRKRDRVVRGEFNRLERLRLHSNRQAAIPSSLVPFVSLPAEAQWAEPIELVEFGHAAAKGESWVVDIPGDPSVASVPSGAAVLAASDAIEPVGKRGQWILLAADDIVCNDGDLVAVTCASGDRLLRRIWSNEDCWTLQSINPVQSINSQVVPKTESFPRKIIGVLYEPYRSPGPSTGPATLEWQTSDSFHVDWITKLATITVKGSSLEPIARSGQRVLIEKEPATDHSQIRNGDLAVVDSKVDSIGCVIKRIYHLGDDCILVSPNPVDPHRPEMLNKSQLLKAIFWTVRGVLFESGD